MLSAHNIICLLIQNVQKQHIHATFIISLTLTYTPESYIIWEFIKHLSSKTNLEDIFPLPWNMRHKPSKSLFQAYKQELLDLLTVMLKPLQSVCCWNNLPFSSPLATRSQQMNPPISDTVTSKSAKQLCTYIFLQINPLAQRIKPITKDTKCSEKAVLEGCGILQPKNRINNVFFFLFLCAQSASTALPTSPLSAGWQLSALQL